MFVTFLLFIFTHHCLHKHHFFDISPHFLFLIIFQWGLFVNVIIMIILLSVAPNFSIFFASDEVFAHISSFDHNFKRAFCFLSAENLHNTPDYSHCLSLIILTAACANIKFYGHQ